MPGLGADMACLRLCEWVPEDKKDGFRFRALLNEDEAEFLLTVV